jgi:hypothetical protein
MGCQDGMEIQVPGARIPAVGIGHVEVEILCPALPFSIRENLSRVQDVLRVKNILDVLLDLNRE